MDFIEHVEKYLGKISLGWKDKSVTDGLQVVSFSHSPFEAVDTFMTIGLSHHELTVSDKKKFARSWFSRHQTQSYLI